MQRGMAWMILSRIRQAVLLLALAVSLTATAYAHRTAAPQDAALAFALANGATLADICAGDLDGDGVRDVHCLACQIAHSVDLPPATLGTVKLELAIPTRLLAPQAARAPVRVVDPAHRPQGPPLA